MTTISQKNKINNCVLTEDQLKTTNGCGSSYFLAKPFRIPKWMGFHYSCSIHDIRYTNGNLLIDKYRADDELYNAMMYKAFHSKNWFMKSTRIKVADFTYWCLSTKLSDKCFMNAKI